MNKRIVFIVIFLLLFLIYYKVNTNMFANTIPVYSLSIMDKDPIFTSQEVPNYIYKNMIGKSIPAKYKSKVNTKSLSYLQVTYFGFDNKSHIGEMIVNSKLADDILDIFKELYEIKYPIEKIKLIDEYNANDELSMSDNNTSCFCYREVSGAEKLSNHSTGRAIDINPLYNPYVTKNSITPVSGSLYADRSKKNKYQIHKNDALYKIFIKHGWSWGGNWSNRKDYQHFEKIYK